MDITGGIFWLLFSNPTFIHFTNPNFTPKVKQSDLFNWVAISSHSRQFLACPSFISLSQRGLKRGKLRGDGPKRNYSQEEGSGETRGELLFKQNLNATINQRAWNKIRGEDTDRQRETNCNKWNTQEKLKDTRGHGKSKYKTQDTTQRHGNQIQETTRDRIKNHDNYKLNTFGF